MKPEEFVIWLSGFLEANPDLNELNAEQTKRLKDKLSTVFNKVTPIVTTSSEIYCEKSNLSKDSISIEEIRKSVPTVISC